jgi:hypothetical protein
LSGGVLSAGTRREVVDGAGDPWTLECYTLREAAEALGRTPLTLRRWMEDGLIPLPAVYDTSHGYRQYLRGDLNAIAKILAKHEQEYSYLRKEHENTVQLIFAEVERYRNKRGIHSGN